MSEARLWDPWQINHLSTAGPKIVLIQLGTERTVASLSGSFRPLRESILTDRGVLSSVPETGRTLPFPFSHGPVSLSLPTRIYGHFLSLSLFPLSSCLSHRIPFSSLSQGPHPLPLPAASPSLTTLCLPPSLPLLFLFPFSQETAI